MSNPRILWPVTIGASNDRLEFDEGGGALGAVLTQATYFVRGGVPAVSDLCTEIATQMSAAGANTYTVTISNTGTVTIARSAGALNFTLHWATDGTGESAAIGTILGFNTAADDGPGTTFNSDYQHQYGWYPEKPIIDGRRRFETAVAGAVRSLGNQQWTQQWSTDWRGDFRVDYVDFWKVRYRDSTTALAASGTEHEAFSNSGSGVYTGCYETLRQGIRFEMHPDVASHTVYATCVVDPEDAAWFEDMGAAVELLMPRGEKYRVTIPMRPYQA